MTDSPLPVDFEALPSDRATRSLGLLGLLLGDAAGVPYEFRSEIRSFAWTGGGSHGMPPGTWSDDGGLALALMHALDKTGSDDPPSVDLATLATACIEWREAGRFMADPGRPFDIGRATHEAIGRLQSGTPPLEAGGSDADRHTGNGALMRILPIALRYPTAASLDRLRLADHAGRVTHNVAASRAACAVYVEIAASIAAARNAASSLADADTTARAIDLDATYRAAVTAAEAYAADINDDDLRAAIGSLVDHPRSDGFRPGGGYVFDTFWTAFVSVMKTETYEDAITASILAGGDTDTTAAVAGGIAALRHGPASLPEEWLRDMRWTDEARQLIAGPAQ